MGNNEQQGDEVVDNKPPLINNVVLQPTSVAPADLSNDEVEVMAASGYVIVQALAADGTDLEQPFTVDQKTFDKVYAKQYYSPGKPKFTGKKKQ